MAIYQGKSKTPVAENVNIDSSVYCVPIGSIIPYSSTTAPKGFMICDGSEISKTDYADLYAVIGDKFGSASDGKFKLPDLRDKFVQGANGNLGESKDAGLPNITGELGYFNPATGGHYYQGLNYGYDAFKQSITTDSTVEVGCTRIQQAEAEVEDGKPSIAKFNASDSNSIYGNSDTVQPPSVCLTYIIKATKMSEVPVDANSIIDDSSVNGEKVTWSAKKLNEEVNKLDTSMAKKLYATKAYTSGTMGEVFAAEKDNILGNTDWGFVVSNGVTDLVTEFPEIQGWGMVETKRTYNDVIMTITGTWSPNVTVKFGYNFATNTITKLGIVPVMDDSIKSSLSTWSSQKIMKSAFTNDVESSNENPDPNTTSLSQVRTMHKNCPTSDTWYIINTIITDKQEKDTDNLFLEKQQIAIRCSDSVIFTRLHAYQGDWSTWKRLCVTSVKDIAPTKLKLAVPSTQTLTNDQSSYCVVNGICYLHIAVGWSNTAEMGWTIASNADMPIPLNEFKSSIAIPEGFVHISVDETDEGGDLNIYCPKLNASRTLYMDFSYPVK